MEELRDRYMTQPHEVSIETYALCNAACVFCPYPTLERKGSKLEDGLIYRLIDQMAEWREPFLISPFKVNEPLLDVRLADICRTVERQIPLARLRLFTNGQPLVRKHIEWIAKLKRVEHLWISLNSTDPDEYGRLMKCSYHIVAHNLDELHRRVAGGEFPHPVMLSRVVQGNPRGDTPISNALSDADVTFHRQCLRRWPRFTPVLIKRDSWLGYVVPGDGQVPRRACARWFELSITAEGQAVLCCMDGKGEYSQGDVHDQSLLAIYNNDFLTACRKASVREGIRPCQTCSY